MTYVSVATSPYSLVCSHSLPKCKGLFPYEVLGQRNLDWLTLDIETQSYTLIKDNLKKSWHSVLANQLELA